MAASAFGRWCGFGLQKIPVHGRIDHKVNAFYFADLQKELRFLWKKEINDVARYETKLLGKQVSTPVEKLDLIPWTEGAIEITLDCEEFTSYCPVTHQPDFGRLTIIYEPDKVIAETKSVKLYLWKFRDTGEFNEKLTAKIANDLFAQLNPKKLLVTFQFNRRGGICVRASAARSSA